MYYSIWVDCLLRIKAQPSNQRDWRVKSMVLMTAAMTFNWLLVINVTEFAIVGRPFYEINFYFLPDELGTLLEFFILFIAPWLIVNYLLIFRNDRYQKLLTIYPYKEGRLFLTYFLSSIFVPIVIMWSLVLF